MLEAQGGADVRAVDGFVATCGPARSATEEGGMIATADHDHTGGGLLLEVTLQAEVRVPRLEHLVVHRTVRAVARDAALAGGLVFEHIRAGLGGMALDATGVDAVEFGPALSDGGSGMGIVAIAAAHLAGHDGVAEGQAELAALVQVTLEARVRGVARIDDGAGLSAGLYVQRGWTVTGFTADLRAIPAGCEQFRVRGVVKRRGEVLVTLRALLRSDIRRPGHLRRCNDRPFSHDAGDEEETPERGASEK